MIMLKMIAQTGNNMFQYAACRTLADNKGYRFSFSGGKKGKLHRYFVLNGETRLGLAVNVFIYTLIHGLRRSQFRVKKKQFTNNVREEIFDESFFDIEDGSTVRGFFQSERYFKINRDNILKWFAPRSRYMCVLDKLINRFPVSQEKRCCIHLRRLDYHDMDDKFEELGWVLPLAYYKEAVSRLPDDLFYLIVSDTPDIAEDAFSFLHNKYIARNNPAVVDMFLFSRCKFNIIANSSFSWWGAWLNQVPDKIVYAPEYHLGWPIQLWCPSGIKVNEWSYINVQSALEKHSVVV